MPTTARGPGAAARRGTRQDDAGERPAPPWSPPGVEAEQVARRDARGSRRFHRRRPGGRPTGSRWPLVEAGQDVEGRRVVSTRRVRVAAGGGHRHDRERPAPVSVEPSICRPRRRSSSAVRPPRRARRPLGSSGGVGTPASWSISATSPVVTAPPGTAGILATCPACVSPLCQLNTVVGDLDGNVSHDRRLRAGRGRARPGGLPRAGHHRLPARGSAAAAGVRRRQRAGPREGRAAPVGARRRRLRRRRARPVQRRGGVRDGEVLGVYHKRLLPNYAVFDEQRYFTPARAAAAVVVGGVPSACRSARTPWSPTGPIARPGRRRRRAGREHQRLALLRRPAGRARADAGHPRRRRLVAVVYVNLVGGQDELVFDGASMVFDADGELIARARSSARCSSSTSTCGRSSASASSTRGAGTAAAPVVVTEARPGSERPATPSRSDAAPWRRSTRSTRRSSSAPATTCEERVHRRGPRPVGRHRLVARGLHRRRRPRARPRARGADAVALLDRALRGPTPEAGRQPGHRPPHDPHRGRRTAPPRDAGAPFEGEPPTSPRRTSRPASGACS